MRLRAAWAPLAGAGSIAEMQGAGGHTAGSQGAPQAPLSADAWAAIDPFDRPQLALVLATCRQARTLSAAGRTLFAVSRTKRRSTNDTRRRTGTAPCLLAGGGRSYPVARRRAHIFAGALGTGSAAEPPPWEWVARPLLRAALFANR